MYTAIKLGDSANQELQRRIVTVQFDNGEGHVFVKDFSFRLTETADNIKKAVKSFLDEINVVPASIDDLTPAPDPVPTQPTQAELDFQEWVKDRADLKKLKELVAEGIIPNNSNQQTTLQTKVNNNWRNTYFNQL
jgi:hypothetical protein